MKKLIKPVMSIENYTEEVVQAFCEYDGCTSNCYTYCPHVECQSIFGWGVVGSACIAVSQVELGEEILF